MHYYQQEISNHKMKETNHDVGITDQDVPSTSSSNSNSSSSSNSREIQKKSPVAVVSSLMEKDHCNDAPHECSSVATCIDEKKKEPKVNATRWRPPTPPPSSSSSYALASSPSTMKQEDAFHDGPDNYKTKWFHVQLPFLFSKQKKQQLNQQHNDGFSMLADDSLVLSSNQSTTAEERHNINYNRRYDSKDDPEDPQPGRQPQGQELDYEKHLLEPSGDQTNSYPNSRSTGSRRKKLPNSIHNFFGRRLHSKHEIHHDHFIQYYGNRNDHFLDNDIVCNNKDQDDNDEDDEREQQSPRSCSNYQMMKSQHGSSSSSSSSRRFLQQARVIPESATSLPLEEETCFFYSGMDQLEHEKKRQIMTSHVASPYSSNDPSTALCSSFFTHQTRRKFVEEHALLNLPLEKTKPKSNDDVDSDMDYDFTTLFTFGCSPLARERNSRNNADFNNCQQESRVPAIADIRKSSLSYIRQGRIEMRLPGDNIRLVMDEFIEPGILSVERDVEQAREKVSSADTFTTLGGTMVVQKRHMDDCNGDIQSRLLLQHSHDDDDDTNTSERETPLLQNMMHDGGNHDDVKNYNKRPPDLRYILTVDQDLYKRILSEMADSKMPCGLYFCCHDAVDGSKSVDISVAVFILIVVFVLLFVGTCVWPTA